MPQTKKLLVKLTFLKVDVQYWDHLTNTERQVAGEADDLVS